MDLNLVLSDRSIKEALADGRIVIWETSALRPLLRLETDSGITRAGRILFTAGESTLVAMTENGKVYGWRTASSQ